jgi:Pyruvate/2-oxoacid:ferredoxin oxidoreductase delta subunit
MQAGLLDTWKHPSRARGAIAWAASLLLIGFYLLLYLPGSTFLPAFPDVLTPVASALYLPSKWFLYGLLYSVAMVVGAFFMLRKHGNSRYHRLRTLTLLGVQVGLAFSLPLALNLAGKPELYLSYVWPLSYDKLFPDTLAALPAAAAIWFVVASLVIFPALAFRYGKRFYCSWVCGCGGLAETFGDPWRHLSDRRTSAWRVEQWSIHGVLVLVLVTTGLVIADGVSRAGVVGAAGGPGGAAVALSTALAQEAAALGTASPSADDLRKEAASVRARVEALDPPAWLRQKLDTVDSAAATGDAPAVASLVHDLAYNVMPAGPLGGLASKLKGMYAFFIGALFSGVAGVGLYPLMGTRVWCRFGCPMAAILGLVQKLGRFRIAVKRDMCISCGNCSAYCEMGIDVRAYAQANLDVRRASCVGCGMCAHVCPRGVLRLTTEADAGPGQRVGEWVLDL